MPVEPAIETLDFSHYNEQVHIRPDSVVADKRSDPQHTLGGQRCWRKLASGIRPQHIELISKNKNFGLNAARDRNSPIKAQQINLQRSLIGSEYQPIAVAVSRFGSAVGTGDGVTADGVPLDPIDQACFLNSSTRTRVLSL
jgi:hypothetical protein